MLSVMVWPQDRWESLPPTAHHWKSKDHRWKPKECCEASVRRRCSMVRMWSFPRAAADRRARAGSLCPRKTEQRQVGHRLREEKMQLANPHSGRCSQPGKCKLIKITWDFFFQLVGKICIVWRYHVRGGYKQNGPCHLQMEFVWGSGRLETRGGVARDPEHVPVLRARSLPSGRTSIHAQVNTSTCAVGAL